MAHSDLDKLLSYCLPLAQTLLKKNDEFYPFAATLHFDGELKPIAIDEGEEHPKPSDMIANFIELFRHFVPRGGLEGIAICYDGRVTVSGQEKRDAITVFLEHANGECVTIYTPYEKKLLRGYVYDPIFATAAERKVFV